MLKAGQQFAHFRIEKKLGEGGMGEVYLAEDQKLTRQVALKIVSEGVFEDSERKERFTREARSAAQVSHPNVMSIFDIGSAVDPETGREQSYIVMEYVRGKSINEYIKSSQPNMHRLIRLAEKTAAGLAAAHQMNIVHRDIKSDNILVDEDGNPRILDFGLAKPIEPLQMEGGDSTRTVSQELTRAGKIIGTVKYMSPEQIQGKPVDSRSDIFSFGILLYSIFTGESPFEAQTQVSTMARILEKPHQAPSLKNQAIPRDLERIIDKCLQKDPSDRYQDTRDLVVDLRNLRRQFDSGVTGAISAVTDSYTVTAKASGQKLQIYAGVAVIAIVLLVLWLTDSFNVSMETSSETLSGGGTGLAIAGFENKTGDVELDWLETGLPEILLTDLSQSQELQIISQQRILDRLPVDQRSNLSYSECSKAAKSLGADRILSGSFYKLGDMLRIDARLEDLNTGKIIMGEKVVGQDPFALVDSLTAKIAGSLNIEHAQTQTLRGLSTPEAFKQYHLGMELFWANEYDSAINRFNQAIAIDSAFALPYMRIAMANIFSNRRTEAVAYFRLAGERESSLPIRERNLFDVYADTWQTQDLDNAYSKLEAMLRDYPEDPEIRSIYALFVDAFRKDTTSAFAHFDTVLAVYPNFAFALEQYAQIESRYSNYPRAIELSERLVRALPNAVTPKLQLAEFYQLVNRWDEARRIVDGLHESNPRDVRPIRRLIRYALFAKDFERARELVERLRVLADGPLDMVEYHNHRANLDLWQGNFKSSLNHRFESLSIRQGLNDSSFIFASMSTIADYYRRFEMLDSSLYYEELGYSYAELTNKISYPIRMVQYDPTSEPEARPIMTAVIDDFRARLPRELWTVTDAIVGIFDAHVAADTAGLIASSAKLIEIATTAQDQELYQGELLIKAGYPEEGRDMLQQFIDGQYRTSNGWIYLNCTYLIARANEAMGDKQAAIDGYREVLKYWGQADIEIEAIRYSRDHLARLTS